MLFSQQPPNAKHALNLKNLILEKEEWYKGLTTEVEEGDLEEEEEVILGSDGQELKEPEVLQVVWRSRMMTRMRWFGWMRWWNWKMCLLGRRI